MERTGIRRISLAWIDPTEAPFDIFREWYDEAAKFQIGIINAGCMATVRNSADGGKKVSSRNILLRAYNENGFLIMTDARSQKVRDLENNPHAAMCFLWSYQDDKNRYVTRQIRIEGLMKKLERSVYQELYDTEPLFCKIQSYVCHQGQPADWYNLNKKCNKLLSKVQDGMELPIPDHVVCYQLIPEMMDFYYTWDQMIADRIRFTRESSEMEWKCERIAA